MCVSFDFRIKVGTRTFEFQLQHKFKLRNKHSTSNLCWQTVKRSVRMAGISQWAEPRLRGGTSLSDQTITRGLVWVRVFSLFFNWNRVRFSRQKKALQSYKERKKIDFKNKKAKVPKHDSLSIKRLLWRWIMNLSDTILNKICLTILWMIWTCV